MHLEQFIPPLIYRVLRPTRKAKRFNSFAEAMKECGEGYDSDAIAKVVVGKTVRYRDSDEYVIDAGTARVATLLGLVRSGTLNVLDMGGAAGAHFFAARRLLAADIKLRWHVVETPAMARAAKCLEGFGLRFFDDTTSAVRELLAEGGLSVVFSSGTIPCVQNPRGLVQRIVDLKAPVIALVRIGLYDGVEDVINVHTSLLSENGPGSLPDGYVDARVRYPFTICSRPSIEAIIREKYRVMIRTEEPGGYLLPEARMFGYYCRAIE